MPLTLVNRGSGTLGICRVTPCPSLSVVMAGLDPATQRHVPKAILSVVIPAQAGIQAA